MQYHGKRKDGLILDVHTSDIYMQILVYIPENRARYTRYYCVDTVGCIHIPEQVSSSRPYSIYVPTTHTEPHMDTWPVVFITKTGTGAVALDYMFIGRNRCWDQRETRFVPEY